MQHQLIFNNPFQFIKGGQIDTLELAFETYGDLTPNKDNVILIHHVLSRGPHVASHAENPEKGWWEALVGPDKYIDTNKFFVICINNLGGCHGSSGPTSIAPATGKPYQIDFPFICFEDIARSQQILLDHLGIKKVYAVIGPSLGGMVSLEWASLYPETWERLIVVSTPCRAYPFNIINRAIQRDIIIDDPAWERGRYKNNPTKTLAMSRMASQLFYRGLEEINTRFEEQVNLNPEFDFKNEHFEIYHYFKHMAVKFSENFDTNAYLYALNTMDYFDVRARFEENKFIFQKNQSNALVIITMSDFLYPAPHQKEVYELLQKSHIKAQMIEHDSIYGHDTFLIEAEKMGEYIRAYLLS